MSSSGESSATDNVPVEILFEKDLSSEEPPREEWSSLVLDIIDDNVKDSDALYDPGSGEICTKYIALSDSFVLGHPYYKYPAILDPGIKQALLNPSPKIIYPDDGQELYLDLCNEMVLCPVKKFYKNLVESVMDLKFYGISLRGIRPMAMALNTNTYVKVLDLTDNWIDEDGCFHLGEMLVNNVTLTELNLSGCRIGVGGARLLCYHLPLSRSLRILNLSKNKLGDDGAEYFVQAVLKGADVTNINLSYNELTQKCINDLSEALIANNKLIHLDLSWNKVVGPNAVFKLCQRLAMNPKFEEIDFSWNALSGLRIGNAFKLLLKNRNVRRIVLRNNRLEGSAIKSIKMSLPNALKLELLDLSYNPMSSSDALSLLLLLKDKKVKLKRLEMEGVIVSEEFENSLQEILQMNNRTNTVVLYGEVRPDFVPKLVSMKELALNRADAIGKRSKKNPKDIALLTLELFEEVKQMEQRKFGLYLKSKGLELDKELVSLLTLLFPGERTKDAVNIDLELMVEYMKRKWPERKLPPHPSPPPSPPPEPTPPPQPRKKKVK